MKNKITSFLKTIFDIFEGLSFAIPYLILTTIGTAIKFIILNILSLISLNTVVKYKNIWSKDYLKTNIVDAWNILITIIFFTLITKYW